MAALKRIRNLLKRNNKEETEKMVSLINSDVIRRSYRRRVLDIDSLRKYDQGEKEIYAPDLRAAVRNI